MTWNCDRCGRFTLPGSAGTSWVHIPDGPSDWDYGMEVERCARCTERHGPASDLVDPFKYRVEMVSGTVAAQP